MSLGVMIHTDREASGLSRAELASRVGVTVSALSYWERDDSAPSRDNLVRLATALGWDDARLVEAVRLASRPAVARDTNTDTDTEAKPDAA